MLQRNTNPWIGLDSYEEGQTIYGRDDEIQLLSDWVMNHTQTILCGRSGIGKTSIINAGVSPVLRKNGFFPVRIRLVHNNNSISYVKQIKNAVFSELKQLKVSSISRTDTEIGEYNELEHAVNEETETLWEFFHRHIFYDSLHNRVLPVVIFDQFEEIFTLERDISKIESFFTELADLLNDIIPDYVINAADGTTKSDSKNINGMVLKIPDISGMSTLNYLKTLDCHLVITLREDYLSCLEQYIRNIPSLKQSKFFLHPINGEEALSIIMKPKPGLISNDVAIKIIATINKDQKIKYQDLKDIQVDSAILSLCLSQLYINKPIQDDVITSTLVDQFDNRIIDNFYTESIGGIPVEIIEYLEDNLVNDDCKRECLSLHKLKKAGVPESYINKLTDERKLLRKFNRNGHSMIEYIHDILCPIVDNHKQIRKRMKERNDGDYTIMKKIKEFEKEHF